MARFITSAPPCAGGLPYMQTRSCGTRVWLAVWVAASLAATFSTGWAAEPTLRVLIFSGQNNHDWKTTTPKLKSILAASGRFAVDVTDHPEEASAASLQSYDVILGNWNAWGEAKVKEWPPAMREAFLAFVRGGKGYVSIHAGSSSFYDWPDYQQIGGMYWQLPVTSHGAPHEFAVQSVGEHPILQGLEPFRTKDELWLKPGLHAAARVIATGDGQPLAATTSYGQGRGFALLLGHSAEFMETVGFQSLLLRGVEWAATGKVTLRGVGDVRGLDPAAVIRSVAAYHWGEDRAPVLNLERLVQSAAAEAASRSAMAKRLAEALAGDATADGKRCLIEGLSLVGSAGEVPALAQALGDAHLFDHARQALERIPGPIAEGALRMAASKMTGPARAALLHSLGARAAEGAVPELAVYVGDSDPQVVGEALLALGAIGQPRAAAALEAAAGKVAEVWQPRAAEALLQCAEAMQRAGQAEEAVNLLERLSKAGMPAAVRWAAYPRWVESLGESGSATVLAALESQDAITQGAGIRALRHGNTPGLLVKAAAQLGKLPTAVQVAVLARCAETGDRALLPSVTQATTSQDQAVRRAAWKTLGALGDATSLEPLLRSGENATEEDRKILVEALARLRGPDVNTGLRRLCQSAAPAQLRLILRALTQRDAREASPELLIAATASDAGVRKEAVQALGRLADAGIVSSLVPLLAKVPETERDALEGALLEAAQRDAKVLTALVEALPQAVPASQAALVNVLGAAGGAPAWAVVRAQLKSPHPAVCLAAVRVLAEHPDPACLDDLLRIVETTDHAQIRAFAARGLSQLAPQAAGSAQRAASALARALAASTDVSAQKSLLSALAEIPCGSSFQAARASMSQPTIVVDAAEAMMRIAEVIYPWHLTEVSAALGELRDAVPTSPLVQRAETLAAKLKQPANLAVGGLATSPDGVDKDGAAGGDQAAIDGNLQTYWDEADNQKLYVLRVQLREPSMVARVRIMAYAHHDFSPKDFEVRCNDQVVKTVREAQYQGTVLDVEFAPVRCEAVELRITSSYGPSPAIRELEIYEKPLAQ